MRRAATLTELLIVLAIVGLMVALLLPAVQLARESSARVQCLSNLRQLTLAVHAHQDARGRLPDLSRLTPSWQLSSAALDLLPYLDQLPLYAAALRSTGEDLWVAPGVENAPPFVRCPGLEADSIYTGHYAWSYPVLGKRNRWLETDYERLENIGPPWRRLNLIPVGASNTALVAHKNSWIMRWCQGPIREPLHGASYGLRLRPRPGTYYLYADWAPLTADAEMPPVFAGAGNTYYARPSSPHPGGCPVGFGDGSVRAVGYEIAPRVWRPMLKGVVGN